MKKLFGLTVLLAAVLFSSCSFNNTRKKGSVDFSIPIGEIIALRNEIAEDAVIEKEYDENQEEIESESEYKELYSFLVQIKGDKGYHEIRYEYLDDTDMEELDNAKFHFSFDNLPADQIYKVMIDVYSEEKHIGHEEERSHALLIYSGDKDNIIVFPGEITRETLVLEETDAYSYSNFNVVVKYKYGTSEKSQTIDLKAPENIPAAFTRYEQIDDNDVTTYTYYFKEFTEENPKTEEDDSAMYWGYEDQDPKNWYEITDLSFQLREDSHFWGFDFKQPRDVYTEGADEPERVEISLEFDEDGICPVYEYLNGESHLFNYPLSAELKAETATISTSMWAPIIIFSKITFKEKEPEENPNTGDDPEEDPNANQGTTEETFTDTQSGEITIQESKLSFEPWNVQEDQEKVRYMTTVPLSTILDGKHLSDGDTIVFILTVDGMIGSGTVEQDFFDQFVENHQFYYQLQVDNWETKYLDDDEGLFKNNNCINYDPRSKGDYTFVMPLNLIQDAKDYKNLQLFFDCPEGTDDNEFVFDSSIKYSIFPAVQKAFVFGVGKNWGKDPNTNPDAPDYRYEINNVLRDDSGNPLDLKGGEKVEVILQGKIRTYSNDAFVRLDESTTFTAELYDNAYYEESSFHALSIDKLDGDVTNTANVKQLTIGSDGGLASYGAFVFSPIAEPYISKTDANFKNDFRFQCHTPCNNPEVLLVVTDYFFTNQVTN